LPLVARLSETPSVAGCRVGFSLLAELLTELASDLSFLASRSDEPPPALMLGRIASSLLERLEGKSR